MVVLTVAALIYALAVLTARFAERRGRHFWVYCIFLLLFPPAMLAVPYLLVLRPVDDLAD
jgi:ABC-type glycerol-3-phosphate transport system permease component